MKNLLLVILTVILVSGFNHIYAQPTVELDIINQHAVGADFYFEIQMQATEGTVYLAGADLVLTFNSVNFTSPQITRSAASYWTLLNTNGESVGSSYRTLTSPVTPITSNEIIINVNSPSFGDQADFDENVAKITNTPVTFGQYKVSGISNTSGNMGLAWKTTGEGVTTKIASYTNSEPWTQSKATLAFADFENAPLPVELTSFTVSVVRSNISLKWQTKTEVDNYGFEVERRAGSGETGSWEKIGFVAGSGNSNSPKEYLFVDQSPIGGSKFNYRLKQIDTDGKYSYTEGVEVELLPNEYNLYQNYPNPFNPSTNIKFALPKEGKVTLKVFNTIGEEVDTLVDGFMEAGIYKINFNAEKLSSGLYIYQLITEESRITKKMILMK